MLTFTGDPIDRYFALQSSHPHLFRSRNHRRLVLDRRRMEAYERENGTELGVLAITPYLMLVVDLVEIERPTGVVEYAYLRIIYANELNGGTNVVIVATIGKSSLTDLGDILLVEQERHATGKMHWELPRGFGEPGMAGEENALKELKEETGFSGTVVSPLGSVYINSGITAARASYYHVRLVDRREPMPEMQEEIKNMQFVSPRELSRRIRTGEIDDAFTIQGLMLLQASTFDVSNLS